MGLDKDSVKKIYIVVLFHRYENTLIGGKLCLIMMN